MRNDNYYTDSRVIAGESSKWYQAINETTMQAMIIDPETGEEAWVAFEYDVCPTCDGKGKHVNPSIDCNGITAEDFAQDPDFAENYFRGTYDVPCRECRGRRVVPTCADERVIRLMKQEAEYQRMCAMERRMGA